MVKSLVGSYSTERETVTTQTYKATHDGAGNRLPYMTRSFISFTFGGKAIEDFGLIVVNNGKLERKAYANFSDNTTTYATLDGQIYWGSHFEANSLDLTLATDEMTEQQLDDFKMWFAPRKERELILSEHPNRAILARVSEPPSISVIPFEKKINLKVNSITYSTSTTVYRGEITLRFVMDEPYWYAKLNYMPTYVDKKTLEPLTIDSENEDKVNSLEDKDMLKIMLEDGLPHQSELSKETFLGGNLLVTQESRVNAAWVGLSYLGVITEKSDGLAIGGSTTARLYYSGTAPCYPTLKFTMQHKINKKSTHSLATPRSFYYNDHHDHDILEPRYDYSGIKIGDNDNVFKITVPSLIMGYNKAQTYFYETAKTTSIPDILTDLQEIIKEKYSRAWAIACVKAISKEGGNYLKDENTNYFSDLGISTLRTYMQMFIDENWSSNSGTDSTPALSNPSTFTFNFKTGEAIGKFKIKIINSTASPTISLLNEIEYSEIEENVGDMVISDYFAIEEKGYLTISTIQSDEMNLTDFLIFYKNMYL